MTGIRRNPVLYGHGPNRIIAVHGWFDDHRAFSAMLPYLDPDLYTLALIDQRGYGQALRDPGPWAISQTAVDLIEWADRLGWDVFTIAGHSMGAKAGLKTALLAPPRVQHLIALTPVWAGAAPFPEEQFSFFRSAATDRRARDGIIRHSTSDRLSDAAYAEMVERSLERSDTAAFAAYFESWSGEDFTSDAEGASVGTTVIVGVHDQAITPQVVEATWLASLPNARMIVLPDCGHYPMTEAPRATAAVFDRVVSGAEL